jgi:ABC-2 type transport system ATP-binding protein
MTAISVRNLSKRYGDHQAVSDVSFQVHEGECVAVLGPNGAGKTTTVEILEGFLRRTSGTVQVLGSDPEHGGRRWRARLGIVPQSTSLDAELTVAETVELFAALYPRPRRAAEVLDQVGLGAEAKVRVGQLSGGQKRRVDFAVGIVGRPQVLFLDEPTTGFDPAARRQAWRIVEELTAEGTTVVLTTHYLEEARRLAHRAVVVAEGVVVADAAPRDIATMFPGPSRISFRLPPGTDVSRLPRPDGGAPFAMADEEWATSTTCPDDTLRALLGWSAECRVALESLTVSPPDFEEVYLQLTSAADLGTPEAEPEGAVRV